MLRHIRGEHKMFSVVGKNAIKYVINEQSPGLVNAVWCLCHRCTPVNTHRRSQYLPKQVNFFGRSTCQQHNIGTVHWRIVVTVGRDEKWETCTVTKMTTRAWETRPSFIARRIQIRNSFIYLFDDNEKKQMSQIYHATWRQLGPASLHQRVPS